MGRNRRYMTALLVLASGSGYKNATDSEAITALLALGGGMAIAADAAPASSDLFKGTGKDIYGMSRGELQRVPPGVLEREIAILEARNEQEKADIDNIKSFNLAMCKRLERLKRECVSHLYISDDHGLDGLNCTDSSERTKEPAAEIRVGIHGAGDKWFILAADSAYYSTPFSAASSAPIKFTREDNKAIKPPRFRDLESLNIIAIRGEHGNRHIHDDMPPIDQLKVKISINGVPLLGGDEEGAFKLIKPDDPGFFWYYRIDPNAIHALGRAPECVVTLKELKELQDNARVR